MSNGLLGGIVGGGLMSAPYLQFSIHISDKNGQFFWRCQQTGNWKIIAQSETYHNRADCEDAVDLLIAHAAHASKV